MADFLETHNTECDNSAYNSPFFSARFARKLLLTFTFKAVFKGKELAGSTAPTEFLNFNVTILHTTVQKKFGLLRWQIRPICRPMPTFKFVPPPLFAFIILTAYSQFCHLILRKIIKIVVTRCYILVLKCTKFDFGWGSTPDPAGGTHIVPPDTLAAFEGSYFQDKNGRKGEKGDGREEKKQGKKKKRKGRKKGKAQKGEKSQHPSILMTIHCIDFW